MEPHAQVYPPVEIGPHRLRAAPPPVVETEGRKGTLVVVPEVPIRLVVWLPRASYRSVVGAKAILTSFACDYGRTND